MSTYIRIEPPRLKSLDLVRPELQLWWQELQPAWQELQPDLNLKVHETLRTEERQAWLYAKGRTTQGPQVTWVQHSPHQDGVALDVYIYAGKCWISGNSYKELALYRQLAQLGENTSLSVFGLQPVRVFNLGQRIGKDWYHFQLEGVSGSY